MASILDPHAEEIRKAVEAGGSQRQLAAHYGVARSTFGEWLKAQDWYTPQARVLTPGAPVQITETDLLRAELSELKASQRKQHKTDVEFERILQAVQDAIEGPAPRFEPITFEAPDPHAHHQALLLSDLHAGEVVDPDAINGMNQYDWDTCVQRMEGVANRMLSFQANRPYAIEELQVWCLGDMVSGKGHAELRETNEFPPAEQAYKVGMLLGQWVEQLIPYYQRLKVYCVPGNHGRVPDKPAAKRVFDSFDWLAYKIAEVYLARYIEEGKLEWITSTGAELVVEIAGQKILLFHGDGIRSTMPGVPWGGVMRRIKEKRSQFLDQANVKLDGFALGHFHQANAVSGPVWMNGSIKGADEWSLKQFGSGDAPEQLLLTFNPNKNRRTDVSYINP